MDTANNNILSIGLLLLFWVWEDSTVKLIVGGFTVIWISRQLYVSFVKRREEKEKHAVDKVKAKKEQELLDLQIRKAKRDLGESDDELGA